MSLISNLPTDPVNLQTGLTPTQDCTLLENLKHYLEDRVQTDPALKDNIVSINMEIVKVDHPITPDDTYKLNITVEAPEWVGYAIEMIQYTYVVGYIDGHREGVKDAEEKD